MKRTKQLLSVMMAVIMLLCAVPVVQAATFDDINDSSVFLKQQGSSTCTLVSAAMMMRRYAMLRGDADWSSITEASLKPTAWVSGQGLKLSFSYKDISVTYGTLPANSSNTSTLINLLAAHPEGVALYRHVSKDYQHAVLLTDYTDGTFYCAEPLSSRGYGRIPISEAYCVTITGATQYWYVTSPRVGLCENHLDIGSDFWAYIVLMNGWKHLENTGSNVQLATGGNNSTDPRQIWHFLRQPDNSYKIMSAFGGLCLDLADGNANNGSNISVCGNNDTSAQRWFVFSNGDGYGIKSACGNVVLDSVNASNAAGNNIQAYQSNGSNAQIFSIWNLAPHNGYF